MKKHVYLAYYEENFKEAQRLRHGLRNAGVKVWWNRDILPGEDKKNAQKRAFDESYAVICCFSKELAGQEQAKFYRELDEAIGINLEMAPGNPYLIPVRFSECSLPHVPIGNSKYLPAIQHADLFPEENRQEELEKLLKSLRQISEKLKIPAGSTCSDTAIKPTSCDSHANPCEELDINSRPNGDEQEPLNEVRVVIVGKAGVGKTSLVNRLLDEEMSIESKPTCGIAIRFGREECKNQAIKLRYWDFGGQVLQYASHQFFLSDRCVYVVVVDDRKDEDPTYWLDHIKVFGETSPIFIVQNKSDLVRQDLPRRDLEQKFPNIQGFYETSCLENQGISRLKRAIQKTIATSQHFERSLPKSWIQIKEQLELANGCYISMGAYRDICRRFQVIGESDQKELLYLLHDLGVMLYFEQLKALDVQILNPEWLTYGVYRIITSEITIANKGIITAQQLDEIFDNASVVHESGKMEIALRYPEEKRMFLLKVMEKFELCYFLENQPDTVLIPDCLDIDRVLVEESSSPAIRFRIRFEFLPRFIMPSFIVKSHLDIDRQNLWRYGVQLKPKGVRAAALVVVDYHQKRMEISVTEAQARDYFPILRDRFHQLFPKFGSLAFTEEIELRDRIHSVWIDYQELLNAKEDGKTEYYVGRLRKTFELHSLLNRIHGVEHSNLIHSWTKDEVLEELSNHLTLLVEELLEHHSEQISPDGLRVERERALSFVAALKAISDKETFSDSSFFKDLKNFLECMDRGDAEIRAAIQIFATGDDYAQKIIENFNTLANWCGAPLPWGKEVPVR